MTQPAHLMTGPAHLMTQPADLHPVPSSGLSALTGIGGGLAGLGAAQAVATVVNPAAAPVDSVGAAFVDLTPAWLKDAAVAAFGTADKAVLIGGMVVVLTVVLAAVGIGWTTRRRTGVLAVTGLTLLAGVAAVTRPTAGPWDWTPALTCGVVTAGCLHLLLGRLGTRPVAQPMSDQACAAGDLDYRTRRRVLVGAAAISTLGALTVWAGRSLSAATWAVQAAAARFPLPVATRPAVVAPEGVDPIGGITPYRTQSGDFYRIDTALTVPRVDPAGWRLRVHGLVEREVEIDYPGLLAEDLVEAWVTLTCVSNPIGGVLAGNAMWLGLPVRDLLARAGPLPGADMVLSHSVDGWTASTPLEALTDDRDALLAVGMNGQPLPAEHGYPARLVVPGLYGYVSATKWVVALEVTSFAKRTAYWTGRGWSERGPVKTASRIDVPGHRATLTAGRVLVGGVAWAQHRGITGVEVQVDDTAWQSATLAPTVGPDTWRQWHLVWQATPGRHRLRVRAIDETGRPQTQVFAAPAPDGATGWHTITVTVS